jgi:hypothetical protein
MSNDLGKFKLDAEKAVLVVIDVQERLVPAMPEDIYLRLRNTVAMLVEFAGLLGCRFAWSPGCHHRAVS